MAETYSKGFFENIFSSFLAFKKGPMNSNVVVKIKK